MVADTNTKQENAENVEHPGQDWDVRRSEPRTETVERQPQIVVCCPRKPQDVEPALRKAFTTHKNDLVFMDFLTDQTANVYPMVAAGKGLSEMILAEEL